MTKPPARGDDREAAPGIAVDAHGGAVIDPTKNVLDLVRAESKYQDAMREELDKRLMFALEAVKSQFLGLHNYLEAFQNAQRDAETKRIDQLAQTRQEFQNTIRDMLAESVRTTSNLVSTQLVQIQATFDTRVTKLEAGAFTQAGKQSVADPALADAMTRMSSSITGLAANTDAAMARMNTLNADAMAKLSIAINQIGTKELVGTSQRMGQGQIIAWIVAGFMLVAAVITAVSSLTHSVAH